ncbi:MAG: hypothetical protein JWO48_612, partial [Bryobacterales bacterium]|nr:hypothetical protein [Bryobacterales bacterium]
DGAQLAVAPGINQFERLVPLGMRADHEGLADFYARAVAYIAQLPGIIHGKPDRFFAEYMLARLGGLNGPRYVQMIGQRIVDDFDFRVGQ